MKIFGKVIGKKNQAEVVEHKERVYHKPLRFYGGRIHKTRVVRGA